MDQVMPIPVISITHNPSLNTIVHAGNTGQGALERNHAGGIHARCIGPMW